MTKKNQSAQPELLQYSTASRVSTPTTTGPEPISRSQKEARGTGNVNVIQDAGVVHQTTKASENEGCFLSCNFLKAIKLNNKGVCLLKAGEGYEEKAIALFTQSLACIKSSLISKKSKTSSPSSSTSPTCSTGENVVQPSRHDLDGKQGSTRSNAPGEEARKGPRPPGSSSPIETAQGDTTIVPIQVLEPKSLDKQLYVYTKAFAFQPSDVTDGEAGEHHLGTGSTVDPDILTAAIIYNIGLGHHILGIRTNSSSFQQRSLVLYELSMGLLQTNLGGNVNNQNHDSENMLIFTMQLDQAHECMGVITSLLIACLNNIGHISYYLQDDYERTCRTRNNLELFLQLFWTTFHEDQERVESSSAPDRASVSNSYFSLLEDDDIQGLAWNVMFMDPPTCAPAA